MSQVFLRTTIITLVLLTTAAGTVSAQIGTPTPNIDTNGMFTSDPSLIQPAPVGPFPAGDDGQLAVVGRASSSDGSTLLVVLRNTTSETLGEVAVSARVSDAGSIVALGTSTNVMPTQIVEPLGLAFVVIPFAETDLASDAVAKAEIRTEASADPSPTSFDQLDVIDVVVEAGEVFIGLVNHSEYGKIVVKEVVAVVCLSDSNSDQPITDWSLLELNETIELDRSATASIDVGFDACTGRVLAAASGVESHY